METGLSFLEFSYSLLQAYDFYYLYKEHGCQGQVGGSDQWGNLTVGIELIEKFYPEKENKIFAFTFNLLTDKEGKKISKSENVKVGWRLDSEKKFFRDFWQNMDDELVKIYIEQFTFLDKDQINGLLELNRKTPSLRILQRVLLELMWFFNYGELESLHNLMRKKLK